MAEIAKTVLDADLRNIIAKVKSGKTLTPAERKVFTRHQEAQDKPSPSPKRKGKRSGPKFKVTEAHLHKIRDLVANERLTLGTALKKLGIPDSTYFDACHRWPEISALIKKSQLHALETEADRRAVEGWDEPKFHEGQPYTVRRFSDTLLIVRLKAACPERYRDNVTLNQTVQGNLGVEHSGKIVTKEEKAAIAKTYQEVAAHADRWAADVIQKPTNGNGNGHAE